jgi:hypothetical protein
MRVKSKHSNKFLIKDEWYQVEMYEYNFDKTIVHSYKLINHTDKVWGNSWFSVLNFYTEQEINRIENLERLDI